MMIGGKVASLWLLLSWLTLFPELDAPVRHEPQPTDAEILAAFPQGAVEIGPNAGVAAVVAHHNHRQKHPHELWHLAQHHDKQPDCVNNTDGEHPHCQRQLHTARHKVAATPGVLSLQPPAFSPEPEPGLPYGDNPPAPEPTRQNRSGFLQGRTAPRVGHQQGAYVPPLLASTSGATHVPGSWGSVHGVSHHSQHSLIQSGKLNQHTDSGAGQIYHHTDSLPHSQVAEVTVSSTAQSQVSQVAQQVHAAEVDRLETGSGTREQEWASASQSHNEAVISAVTQSESKSLESSTSTSLLVAANSSGNTGQQQSEVRTPSAGDGGHGHKKSGTVLSASSSDQLATTSDKESTADSQNMAGTGSVTETAAVVSAESDLVTAALDETSLVVEPSVVMPALMSLRAAFFAAPLLSGSWSEQSSAAEAAPVNAAPLAYAVASGSQAYVLDQLTGVANYAIRLQGSGSGTLQKLTLAGSLADGELALQGIAVGSSGWQCQHDASSFSCETANTEDGAQPLSLQLTVPATMGTHTLQLTVTTTTDASQQSREHSRTLAFGQAMEGLQQQLEQAEESGATAFILPEGIYVGTLYNRPAYPLTLIGSAHNQLWLQGDTAADPLLSADSLEQVRLHGAGAIAVSGTIRHSDLRLENNLLVAEAAAARLSAPAALFAANTGHKPYRQLLGNTLVNITALADDATQASWQVANNLLLSEVTLDSFTLLGGDLQGVSFSHNLLPSACQLLPGENLYSDAPGVSAATGYLPASDSPALDAGDAGMAGELTDLYGNSRLVGASVDIGAVERQ